MLETQRSPRHGLRTLEALPAFGTAFPLGFWRLRNFIRDQPCSHFFLSNAGEFFGLRGQHRAGSSLQLTRPSGCYNDEAKFAFVGSESDQFTFLQKS
jgi:hypothetical protein